MNVLKELESKLDKALIFYRDELKRIRAGRASTGLVEHIKVDSYGMSQELIGLAAITTPDQRTIVIQPWDSSILSAIEKAIMNSDLGINPVNDGKVIRLSIPTLTEDRRKDLVKQIGKLAEESKISIRNIRRDVNEEVKEMKKKSEISEDEEKSTLNNIQKSTDKAILTIDDITKDKEKELMSL